MAKRRVVRESARTSWLGVPALALFCAVVWALWPKAGGAELAPVSPPLVRVPRAPREEAEPAPAPDPLRLETAAAEWERLARDIWRDDMDEAKRRADYPRWQALNDKLVWTREVGPGFLTTPIEEGDSYWKIARRLQAGGVRVSPGFLMATNQVPAARLRGGQVLKVPSLSLALVVDQSDYRVFLVMGDFCLSSFAVGIGRGSLTPTGSFTVGEKIVHPPWTDPATGRLIRFGQPGHLIGTRWIGLHQGGRKTALGLHGTVTPSSIGKSESDGCVRLLAGDLEMLFEWVADGMEVLIRR